MVNEFVKVGGIIIVFNIFFIIKPAMQIIISSYNLCKYLIFPSNLPFNEPNLEEY